MCICALCACCPSPSPALHSTYNFWDKDSKQRLKAMQKSTYGTEPAPITCGSFNADGSIFAYALSYDWSKGFQNYNPQQMQNWVHLHGTQEAEVRGRRGRVGGCIVLWCWVLLVCIRAVG